MCTTQAIVELLLPLSQTTALAKFSEEMLGLWNVAPIVLQRNKGNVLDLPSLLPLQRADVLLPPAQPHQHKKSKNSEHPTFQSHLETHAMRSSPLVVNCSHVNRNRQKSGSTQFVVPCLTGFCVHVKKVCVYLGLTWVWLASHLHVNKRPEFDLSSTCFTLVCEWTEKGILLRRKRITLQESEMVIQSHSVVHTCL